MTHDRRTYGRQTRSSRRSMLYLGGGLTAALAGGGIWSWWRSTRRPGVGKTLAVVRIDNRTGDASLDGLDRSLCDLFTINLAGVGWLKVVSTERVREVLARWPSLKPAQIREVAREAGAELFLTGTITQSGSTLHLQMGVAVTSSGNVLFEQRAESPNPEAVFNMVDQATAGLLAQLGPDQLAGKPGAAAALTGNLAALLAYEQGQRESAQSNIDDAIEAYRRAIALDPNFTAAHLFLAGALQLTDLPESRRLIARAAELSALAPVPPYYKMMIQMSRFYLDRRLDECAKVLETARRDFPHEIGLLTELAGVRYAEWRLPEAQTLLEQAAARDERSSVAYSLLAYVYAFQGDMPRALASAERYAALLPPKDWNAAACRGDVFALEGRLGEALTEYRKIDYHNAIAAAALHAGDYRLAETEIDIVRQRNPARAASERGALHVARGQLERAVPYYEDAADGYANPHWAWANLLKAGQIWLELRHPEALLDLARRHKSPWAAGLRATSLLLLERTAEAETEFNSLLASLTPLIGEYGASMTVAHHRLLAAFYAGRYQEVLRSWPTLYRPWWNLFALEVGRAYLEVGSLGEAERHLRFAHRAQLGFGASPDLAAQHNYFTWVLAQFYLGVVLEKTGRADEAVTFYGGFLKHFQNSAAPLPQIDVARQAIAKATGPRPIRPQALRP